MAKGDKQVLIKDLTSDLTDAHDKILHAGGPRAFLLMKLSSTPGNRIQLTSQSALISFVCTKVLPITSLINLILAPGRIPKCKNLSAYFLREQQVGFT